MNYFPLFFDLRGKSVLIVGGGEVAFRKAQLLSRAGAVLHIVAPEIRHDLTVLAAESNGITRRRKYVPDDVIGCHIVVAAGNDETINRQISADAKGRGIPVNVVDRQALCDFIFPALIDRSPLVVAVSSSGASPVLARRLRAKIEALLPPALGKLAAFCGRWRSVKAALPAARRRIFWEEALDGAAATAVFNGDEKAADNRLREHLRIFADGGAKTGEVYLIGAGPGAADLLTLQATRLLQCADVVIHDRLASKEVVDLARRDAEKIFVGKARNQHGATQKQINDLLIKRARNGLRVARLKGGDPFIFGRGGEEAASLAAAGVPYQIAPGISAANGCAAYAGIPLTHRNTARAVRFATAYRDDMTNAEHWRRLAEDTDTTLVFYMAGATLANVAKKLITAGRATKTPVAVISRGTTTAQKVICGELANIAAIAADAPSPALIIIGEVVLLHGFLRWFGEDSNPASPFASLGAQT
ncbi:MAG: siroheme synthase CysG [Candidatus Zeuxoniibacter abyssi]|nr:MAG: siroheme synthase CysG [Candidatus Persebacteraceae bacterium AB1(2)]